MLPFLFTFLTIMSLTAREPIIKLSSSHTYQPINPIKQVFQQIPSIDAERKAIGVEPVIDLSIGQPHIPLQMQAIDSFIEYLESLKTMPPDELSKEMGYGNGLVITETRQLISRLFSESYPEVAGGFIPEEVMTANGATGAMNAILNVLVDAGDEIVIFAPYFSIYEQQVRSLGGSLISIPLSLNRSNSDLLDETLRSHPKIKALIWNDPNNPLGTKANREELQNLAQVIEKYPDLIIIHDEIYKDIVHNDETLSLLNVAPQLKARSFIIRCIGKDILGAPAIRGGMIAAPISMQTSNGSKVNFIKLMTNQQFLDGSGISILVQKIVGLSIEQKLSGVSREWEIGMKKEYAENIKSVVSALLDMGLKPLVHPNGAFYVMADASRLLGKSIPRKIGCIDNLHTKVGKELKNDIDIASFFLHAAGVAVVPGSSFGTDHCSFRISCTKPKDRLIQATQRMKKAIESLE